MERAANIAQTAWYLFRANAYDVTMSKMEEKDGVLLLLEREYRRGEDAIKPFPVALSKNHNKMDVKAALVMLTCNDSLAMSYQLLEEIFKGLFTL